MRHKVIRLTAPRPAFSFTPQHEIDARADAIVDEFDAAFAEVEADVGDGAAMLILRRVVARLYLSLRDRRRRL